jgi:hypothetical protein
MKRRRLIAMACLFVALIPQAVWAQTTTTTTTGNGGGSTNGGGNAAGPSTGVSLGGVGSGGNSGNGQQASPTIQLFSTSSGTGSATGVPSTTNPFVSSYGDALSMGLPSKFQTGPPATPTATFGKGIYTTTVSTSSAGGAATTATQTNGFTTVGTLRNPSYSTGLSDDLPVKVHSSAAIHSEVRDVIDRSEKLKNKSAIQVTVNGNTVILRGQVGTVRERQLAEAMVSMTPGVRGVQNQLTVAFAK